MSQPKSFSAAQVELPCCRMAILADPQDALIISEILAQSSPWSTLQISATALQNYLNRDDPALRRYVISVADQIAGIICIRHPWLRGPYIELLGLADQYRGYGIGRTVLAWVEEQARFESKNLWVITSSFNHEALAFYHRHGFTKVGNIEKLITPEHDEILLRKCLA